MIGNTSIQNANTRIEVLYGIMSLDHFPITMTILVDGLLTRCSIDESCGNCEIKMVDWSCITEGTLQKYTNMTGMIGLNITCG